MISISYRHNTFSRFYWIFRSRKQMRMFDMPVSESLEVVVGSLEVVLWLSEMSSQITSSQLNHSSPVHKSSTLHFSGLFNDKHLLRMKSWSLNNWWRLVNLDYELMLSTLLQTCSRFPFSTLYTGGIWSSISSVLESSFQQPTWISASIKDSNFSFRQPRVILWNSKL